MFSERIEKLRRTVEEKTVKGDIESTLRKCEDLYSSIYKQVETARNSEDPYERSLAWIIYVLGQGELPSGNEEKYQFFRKFVEQVKSVRKSIGDKDEVSYNRKS